MNLTASVVVSQPLEACSVPKELVFGHASGNIDYYVVHLSIHSGRRQVQVNWQ